MSEICGLIAFLLVGVLFIVWAWYMVQPDDRPYDLETDIMALLDDIHHGKE